MVIIDKKLYSVSIINCIINYEFFNYLDSVLCVIFKNVETYRI